MQIKTDDQKFEENYRNLIKNCDSIVLLEGENIDGTLKNNFETYKKFCFKFFEANMSKFLKENIIFVYNKFEKQISNLFDLESKEPKDKLPINDTFIINGSFNIYPRKAAKEEGRKKISKNIILCFSSFYNLAFKQKIAYKDKEIEETEDEDLQFANKFVSIRDQMLLLHLYRLFSFVIKGPGKVAIQNILLTLETRLGIESKKKDSPFEVSGLLKALSGFTSMLGVTDLEKELEGKDIGAMVNGVLSNDKAGEVIGDVISTFQKGMGKDGDMFGAMKNVLNKDFIPPEMRVKLQGLIPAEMEKPKELIHPHVVATAEAIFTAKSLMEGYSLLIKNVREGMPDIVPSDVSLEDDLSDNLIPVVQAIRASTSAEKSINVCNNFLSDESLWRYKKPSA